MAKFIRITFLTIFFISCSDDVKTKSSVAFSDKDYSEAFQLIDSSSTVSSIAFDDLDLDLSELGGSIAWTEAGDTTLVTHYYVYFVEGTSGKVRSQIGTSVPVATGCH